MARFLYTRYHDAIILEGFWPRKWTLILERWTIHLMWWHSEPPQPHVAGDLRDIYIGWVPDDERP